MKSKTLNLILAVVLMLNIGVLNAQNAKPSVNALTKEGKEINNLKTVNSDEINILFLTITHLPDLSKYDRVSIGISKDISSKGGFLNMSGKEFMDITKDSKKTPGMKYINLILTNNDGNKGCIFNIDEFAPYRLVNDAFLYSKEGNKNASSYVLTFTFSGQYIERYEEEWINGVLKQKPIYGNFIPFAEEIQVTIYTSDKIAPIEKRNDVHETNSLLDAINAGNKQTQKK